MFAPSGVGWPRKTVTEKDRRAPRFMLMSSLAYPKLLSSSTSSEESSSRSAFAFALVSDEPEMSGKTEPSGACSSVWTVVKK